MRRSSRRFCWLSMHSASPRSAFRLRSWNSSKMTQPMPASAASSCSMRVRMPSVTTSMRVSRLTRVSSRVRNPTVSADRFAEQLRHAAGDGARRNAARLEHQDLLSLQPGTLQQGERHDGALAGARRRLQQHAACRASASRSAGSASLMGRSGSDRRSHRLHTIPQGIAAAAARRPHAKICAVGPVAQLVRAGDSSTMVPSHRKVRSGRDEFRETLPASS